MATRRASKRKSGEENIMPKKTTIITEGIDLDAIDVNELLEETADTYRGGTRCWAYHAEGKLREYLEGCKKRLEQNKPFRMARALEIAQKKLGVNVGISAFRNHILGKCSCGKKEKR